MKHATSIAALGLETVDRIIAAARAHKGQQNTNSLAGKLLGMLFFNPSLRTRASFEAVMLRSGGHAIVLDAGQDTWQVEMRSGAVMDGDRPEHLSEAVGVLSRYVDALAVRTFAGLTSDDLDDKDEIVSA